MAGHEFGGEKKHYRVGDFVGAARSVQRGKAGKLLLPFRRIAGHGNGAGSQSIDANGRTEFFGKHTGHENDAGFGQRVWEKFAPANDSADVGKIDDDAAAGFREMRSSGLRTEKRGSQVGVERSVPSGFGSFQELGFEEVSGAVDENVALAAGGDALRDEAPEGGDVGEVGGKCRRAAAEFFDLGDNLLRLHSRFAVVDGNVRAFLGESERDDAAKPLPGSRDEGHSAMQSLLFGHAHKLAHLGREPQGG